MPPKPRLDPKPPHAPSKLTPERAGKFLQAVAIGNYLTVAAKYAGITPMTFRNWRNDAAIAIADWNIAHPGESAVEVLSEWLEAQGAVTTYERSWKGWDAEPAEGFEGRNWLAVLLISLMEKAEAQAEVQAVTRIQAAASNPNHWQAAMTFLERRHSERWARPTQMQLTGPGGGPVQVSAVTSDQLVARVQELRDKAAEKDAQFGGQKSISA